jgi:hypothetical protein
MSKRIPFNRQINHALLTEELRDALSTIADGIVFDFTNEHGEIILTDEATAQDARTAQSVVEAHDATKLTAAQQAEINHQAKLNALRKPWNQWTAQDQAELVRLMAEQMGLIPAE